MSIKLIKMIGALFQPNGKYPTDDKCPEVLDDCEIEALTYQASKCFYNMVRENHLFWFFNCIYPSIKH